MLDTELTSKENSEKKDVLAALRAKKTVEKSEEDIKAEIEKKWRNIELHFWEEALIRGLGILVLFILVDSIMSSSIMDFSSGGELGGVFNLFLSPIIISIILPIMVGSVLLITFLMYHLIYVFLIKIKTSNPNNKFMKDVQFYAVMLSVASQIAIIVASIYTSSFGKTMIYSEILLFFALFLSNSLLIYKIREIRKKFIITISIVCIVALITMFHRFIYTTNQSDTKNTVSSTIHALQIIPKIIKLSLNQ